MSAVSATYFCMASECLGMVIQLPIAVAYAIGLLVAVLFLGIFLYTIHCRHTQPCYESVGK
jgi:hypothetical protein